MTQKRSIPVDYLQKLLRQKESENLEFKSRISSPFKAAKELAAMANTLGGRLIVGVEDDGSIKGVDNPDEEKAVLLDAALNYCDPPLTTDMQTAFIEGQVLIVVFIPRSSAKHMICDPRGNRLFYVRVRDKNLQASQKTARKLKDGPDKAFPAGQLSRQEKILVDYLKKHEKITLQEFARCANISRRRASRIIVKFERASLIRRHDLEKRAFYTLNPGKGGD